MAVKLVRKKVLQMIHLHHTMKVKVIAMTHPNVELITGARVTGLEASRDGRKIGAFLTVYSQGM